jgi:hypothetical protein
MKTTSSSCGMLCVCVLLLFVCAGAHHFCLRFFVVFFFFFFFWWHIPTQVELLRTTFCEIHRSGWFKRDRFGIIDGWVDCCRRVQVVVRGEGESYYSFSPAVGGAQDLSGHVFCLLFLLLP